MTKLTCSLSRDPANSGSATVTAIDFLGSLCRLQLVAVCTTIVLSNLVKHIAFAAKLRILVAWQKLKRKVSKVPLVAKTQFEAFVKHHGPRALLAICCYSNQLPILHLVCQNNFEFLVRSHVRCARRILAHIG